MKRANIQRLHKATIIWYERMHRPNQLPLLLREALDAGPNYMPDPWSPGYGNHWRPQELV